MVLSKQIECNLLNLLSFEINSFNRFIFKIYLNNIDIDNDFAYICRNT